MIVENGKVSIFSYDNIGIYVETPNQSKKHPVIWLVHGSGGISSDIELWKQTALERQCAVVIVDSFSNRGIFKQYWELKDEDRVDPSDRALDQIYAYQYLRSSNVIPYCDLENVHMVGFSIGGAAAILCSRNKLYWKQVHALYPAVRTIPIVDTHNLHLYVGYDDMWTPAKDCLAYSEHTGCDVVRFRDVYHGFSKPGIDHWFENIPDAEGNLGVKCKYDDDATKVTMAHVWKKI